MISILQVGEITEIKHLLHMGIGLIIIYKVHIYHNYHKRFLYFQLLVVLHYMFLTLDVIIVLRGDSRCGEWDQKNLGDEKARENKEKKLED